MADTNYGTYTYTDVVSEIAGRRLNQKIGQTCFYATSALEKLAEGAMAPKSASGYSHFEQLVYAQDTARAKNFIPGSTGDGQTAVEFDNFITLTANYAFTFESFLVDAFKNDQVGSADGMGDLVRRGVDGAFLTVRQKANRNIYYGAPATNSQDPFGLKELINYTGTIMGVNRNLSRALVGNRLDAGKVATNLSNTDTGGGTVTVGSANVTLVNAITCDAGDEVWITTGSGNSAITVKYYAAAAVSASTALTITPTLRAIQSSQSGATVTINAPFYAANTGMGAANAKDVAKYNKAISVCTDGNEKPTHMFTDSEQYSFLRDQIQANEQNITPVKNEYGPKEYFGFRFGCVMVEQDNNINRGEAYIININNLQFYGSKSFLQPTLMHGKVLPEAAVTSERAGAMIGKVALSRQLMTDAFNRHALILNLTA